MCKRRRNKCTFLENSIGYQDSQSCALMEKEWELIFMKEEDCDLMIMTACGSLSCDNDARMSTRANNDATFEFKHSEADDHNNKRHDS